MAAPFGNVAKVDSIGAPLPLVERTPDGGIVLANEYVRASVSSSSADGLRIDGGPYAALSALIGKEDRYRGETSDALRWIRSPRVGESLVVREQWNIGGGPTLDLYRECGGVWERAPNKAMIGYFSVVRRSGDLLALEARSEGDDQIRQLVPHAIVRLEGTGGAPRLPTKACIEKMSAATDGTLLVVGAPCPKERPNSSDDGNVVPAGPLTVDVGIYAPNATTTKLTKLTTALVDLDRSSRLVAYAVSKNELYVGVANELHVFDGSKWSSSTIAAATKKKDVAIRAIGHTASTLYLATTEGLLTQSRARTPESRTRSESGGQSISQSAWQSIPLPSPPADPLDTTPAPKSIIDDHFGSEPPLPNRGKPLPLVPLRIDTQRDDEILILARAGDTTVKEPAYPPGIKPGMKWVPVHEPGDGYEIVLLSTKKREPVLRLPSQFSQLASMPSNPPPQKKKKPNACMIDFRVAR